MFTFDNATLEYLIDTNLSWHNQYHLVDVTYILEV